MKHKEKLPTGVEIIYNTQLKNMLLVEIPRSKFHILGVKQLNNNWNIGIIDKLGSYKRKIEDNITERTFKTLINTIINEEKEINFKSPPTINKLKDYYKSLLKQFENQR